MVRHDSDSLRLGPKDLRGSRLRCLMLTSLSRERVAQALTALVKPFALVSPKDFWMPGGFLKPDEAKLGETPGFLCAEHREMAMAWWLKVRHQNANTPNWDIASTCTIGNKQGLILAEAKAHDKELRTEGKRKTRKTNKDNHNQIGAAIRQANNALNDILPGWALSRDSHYQLANRFAWAWKVTDLGCPVVLVYLGFLNATEMEDQGRPFSNHQEWRGCVQAHSNDVVPIEAWGSLLDVGSTPLVPLIRSAEFSITSSGNQ